MNVFMYFFALQSFENCVRRKKFEQFVSREFYKIANGNGLKKVFSLHRAVCFLWSSEAVQHLNIDKASCQVNKMRKEMSKKNEFK